MIWQVLKKKIDGVDAEPQLLQVFRRTDPGIQQRTSAVQVQVRCLSYYSAGNCFPWPPFYLESDSEFPGISTVLT